MENYFDEVMKYLKDRECSMTIETVDGCWVVRIFRPNGSIECEYSNTDLEKAISLAMNELLERGT